MKISNWTANNVFLKTRKVAIVAGPIGGLGRTAALAMGADEAVLSQFHRSPDITLR
jgi:hypothetical protein